jgi:DNA invertase Pin-like site-specific DNA recombinase
MKRAVLYMRVSTADQTTDNQAHDLQQMAKQRGLVIVERYIDHGISGTRSRRPGLDRMMADGRKGKFDVVLVWACDRLARSTKHFLETLDELNRLGIEFTSFREQLDTGGALGRAVVTIISVVAELERSLIVERVKAGMRRARLEGRQIGRAPLEIDRAALLRDRARGVKLTQLAKTYGISKASVCRIIKDAQTSVSQGFLPAPSTSTDIKELTPPKTAA